MQGVTSFCPTTLPPLSFFWRNHLDLGREPLMRRQIYRPVLHLGARRVFPKEIVIVPIHRRSNRSRDEPAAAIRANISQNAFDAGGTKGTLIGADTRLKRVWRQCFVQCSQVGLSSSMESSEATDNGQSMIPEAFFFYQLGAGRGTVVNSGSSTYRALDADAKPPTR